LAQLEILHGETTVLNRLPVLTHEDRRLVNVLVLNLQKKSKGAVSKYNKNVIVFTPRGLLVSRIGEETLKSFK